MATDSALVSVAQCSTLPKTSQRSAVIRAPIAVSETSPAGQASPPSWRVESAGCAVGDGTRFTCMFPCRCTSAFYHVNSHYYRVCGLSFYRVLCLAGGTTISYDDTPIAVSETLSVGQAPPQSWQIEFAGCAVCNGSRFTCQCKSAFAQVNSHFYRVLCLAGGSTIS